MDVIAVTLAVADGDLDRFDEIVAALEALDFEFRMTLPMLGLISGAIPRTQAPALRRIPGVTMRADAALADVL